MADKTWSTPRSAGAIGMCPHVAEIAVAYQNFANGVDHQVGIVLCSYKLHVAN